MGIVKEERKELTLNFYCFKYILEVDTTKAKLSFMFILISRTNTSLRILQYFCLRTPAMQAL